MAEPPASLSSLPAPPLPPNDLLPKRYKVIWRVLLISNFSLAAYMFASARKKDLDGMENYQVDKDIDGNVSMKLPSKFMADTTTLVSENIPDDQQREQFQWIGR